MSRIFKEDHCSLEVEEMLVSIGKETGFGSLAIDDLYQYLLTQNTPELLMEIAVDASKCNQLLPFKPESLTWRRTV